MASRPPGRATPHGHDRGITEPDTSRPADTSGASPSRRDDGPVRGRYAPSPTGRFHLGNVRTALVAWLQIRALQGVFVMRIEDVDLGRSRPEHERGQLEDLRWLGLDWDEGPDVGGGHGPYRQSERATQYEAALATLDTFPCTCSRKELRTATLTPDGGEPLYPGTCRGGPTHPERDPARRWRVPLGTVEVVDTVYGPLRQDVRAEVGEFVLSRRDGAWAYQLAVVVDDAAMGITHVVRGADLLDSTPRQVLLQRALGVPTPAYAHVPIVVGPDGAKLGKRHGAPDVTALREGGADPARVVAALARSLGLVGDEVGRVTPRELLPDFALSRLAASRGDVLDLGPLHDTD